MANKNLSAAKKAKNDEFYSMYEDVEKELKHYTQHLKDKVVYCNCDTEESNFYKYFKNNFETLGLKGLLRSSLADGIPFQSEAGIDMLKQADIVVTNPPFSLFRDFVKLMFEYDKKFLVIGNQNAITYKECFKHIKENKMWLGVNKPSIFNSATPPSIEPCSIKLGNEYSLFISGNIIELELRLIWDGSGRIDAFK